MYFLRIDRIFSEINTFCMFVHCCLIIFELSHFVWSVLIFFNIGIWKYDAVLINKCV